MDYEAYRAKIIEILDRKLQYYPMYSLPPSNSSFEPVKMGAGVDKRRPVKWHRVGP